MESKEPIFDNSFQKDSVLNSYHQIVKQSAYDPLSFESIIVRLKLHQNYRETWLSYLLDNPALKSLVGHQIFLELVIKYFAEHVFPLSLEKIYEFIFQSWFKFKQAELEKSGLLKDYPGDLIEDCWVYVYAVALKLNESCIDCIDFNDDSFAEESVSEKWSQFFTLDPRTQIIARCCPWQVSDDYQLGFYHRDIVDYFANLTKYDLNNYVHLPFIRGDEGLEQLCQILNREVLTTNSNQASHLVADIINGDITKEDYFRLIYLSRTKEEFIKIAANAMTILNQARIVFSGMDMHGIRVPGADLSKAILDNTDLQKADLRNCNLQRSWLRRTNFSGAYMDDIHLGGWPYLQLPAESSSFIVCHSCAYSPDGRWLVVGGADLKIYFYDAHTYLLKHILTGKTGNTRNIAFNPSGKTFVCADEVGVYLWDTDNQIVTHTLSWPTPPGNNGNGIVFSPDGQMLAVGGREAVYLWKFADGIQVYILSTPNSAIWSIDFSPNGRLLVSGGTDGTIQLWQSDSRILQSTLTGHSGPVNSVAFSLDGQVLASGSYDRTVRLWSTDHGTPLHIFAAHNDWVTSVAFNPRNGQMLASGSKDGNIHLWDYKSKKLLQTFIVNSGGSRISGTNSITFSTDGRILFSRQYADIRLWDTSSRSTVINDSTGHSTGYVHCIAFSPDGHVLASGGDDGIYMWDLDHNRLVNVFADRKAGSIFSVAFSPDGQILAFGGRNMGNGKQEASTNLLELQTRTLLYTFMGPLTSINGICFSPDGQMLIGAGDGVCIWDIKSRALLRIFNQSMFEVAISNSHVQSLALSPDGKTIAGGCHDGKIRLWDSVNGALKYTFEHKDGYGRVSLVFSPDGRWLVSASTDNYNIYVWDVIKGILINTLNIQVYGMTNLVFSSNGRMLIGGRGYGSFFLWDFEKQRGYSELLFPGSGHDVYVCWHETPAGWFLGAGCGNCVRYWEISEESIQLVWTSHMGQFTAADAKLEGVRGLSDSNLRFFHQHGANKGDSTLLTHTPLKIQVNDSVNNRSKLNI